MLPRSGRSRTRAGKHVTRRRRIWLKAAVWLLCLAPLGALAWRLVTDPLVTNPIDVATDTLGDWTLRILLLSLTMTPLRILFGLSWPVTLRRLLGLFAFSYALLHFSVWIVLDHFFDWPTMAADVVKRPYITVGFTAFLLLVPLAATSTAGMVRRLGAVAWRRLHRLVYLIAILGVLHFLWLAKVGVPDPYYYAGWLLVLLAVRVGDAVRRARIRARQAVPGAGLAPRPARPV
jgi:methionine sulfoxide reductase heme-binding subunit